MSIIGMEIHTHVLEFPKKKYCNNEGKKFSEIKYIRSENKTRLTMQRSIKGFK